MSGSDCWKPEVEESVQVFVAVKGMRNKKEPGRKAALTGPLPLEGCSGTACSLCPHRQGSSSWAVGNRDVESSTLVALPRETKE